MNTPRIIRTAVVGAGFFGRYHAQQYSSLPGVELVGVADHDLTSAARLASEVGCKAYTDPNDLLGLVDVVSVVTPTIAHFAIAEGFLRHGVAVLVEKPIAASLDEARSLVRTARQQGSILQVGHVERFNPVWSAFESASFRPTFIEARRASPYPFRSLDVSVVFDVMIHDIDLVLAAAGSQVSSVDAVGARQLSPSCDRAEAFLSFANGCRAHLSVSRVHHRTERTMRLTSDLEGLDLDFFERKSVHYRLQPTAAFASSLKAPTTPEERERRLAELFETTTQQHDKSAQPLRAELESFVECVRTGKSPKADGEAGLEALTVAQQIEQRIESGRSIRKAA
jgi:predicted dehydrogenase